MCFVAAVRAPGWKADYPNSSDLHELLALPSNQARTRLWFDDSDRLTGYGLVDHFDNVWFDVARGGCDDEIGRAILSWAAEAVMLDRQEAPPSSLDTNCRSEDVWRIALLSALGFASQGCSTLKLVRDLRWAIPEPCLQPGWTIRAMLGEGEVDAWVELHRAAYGTDHLTVEERLSWMRTPGYCPELDLVLNTETGALAGYCMCGIEGLDETSGLRRGYTDPIAVHPGYRGGRGARALISRGMAMLAERGVEEAILSTSSENGRMLRVAFSLGYSVESSRQWYSKSLR